MDIRFEPKERVVASYMGHTVLSDIPVDAGGEDAALNPFQLMLAALGNCAGVFMKAFYRKHGLSFESAWLHQDFEFYPDGMLKKVLITVHTGKQFPKKLEKPLLANLKACKVKRHLSDTIAFEYNIVE